MPGPSSIPFTQPLSLPYIYPSGSDYHIAQSVSQLELHPCFPQSDSNVTAHAILVQQLSFLACDFVLASAGGLASPALAPQFAPTFPCANLSPVLWHHCLSHLGMDAVHTLLMKALLTGVECSGSFDRIHCIACLIGKALQ